MEEVTANYSLQVGMQKLTYRKNGKKVVKEKVFHIIWEKDSELTNDEDTISEKTDLSDDDDLSKNQITKDFRQAYKRCRKLMQIHNKDQYKFSI